jgi:nucleotide-binding universal stress UspA family protein
MYKHILIATDGSDFAAKGVRHGLQLAKSLGSKATITTAMQTIL